jgi:hypothetical protein
MQAILIILAVVAVFIWAWKVATYYTQKAPESTKCTGDCNQGRNCTCIDQERLRLEDEFNNSNWPFPVKKP